MAQLLVEPDMYLDEIQSWAAIRHEVGISKSSLVRLIADVGFFYKSLHKAALERDEGGGGVVYTAVPALTLRIAHPIRSRLTSAKYTPIDRKEKK